MDVWLRPNTARFADQNISFGAFWSHGDEIGRVPRKKMWGNDYYLLFIFSLFFFFYSFSSLFAPPFLFLLFLLIFFFLFSFVFSSFTFPFSSSIFLLPFLHCFLLLFFFLPISIIFFFLFYSFSSPFSPSSLTPSLSSSFPSSFCMKLFFLSNLLFYYFSLMNKQHDGALSRGGLCTRNTYV